MYVLAPNQTVETFPYSIGDLRRDNPSVSFPRNPSIELLAAWSVYPVVARPAPSFDAASENCTQIDPTLEGDQWLMTWQVTSASTEEIAERLVSQSAEVRQKRNELLTNCDWTQLADTPLSDSDKSAWATYRQSLRDLSNAEGFPFAMAWPSEPS
tara:strand:- start:1732 stop:2196 length:465 start_codon:yes stop_codon:yes gene_type:complete